MWALACAQMKDMERRLAGLPKQDPGSPPPDLSNPGKWDGKLRYYFSKACPLLISAHFPDGDTEAQEGVEGWGVMVGGEGCL